MTPAAKARQTELIIAKMAEGYAETIEQFRKTRSTDHQFPWRRYPATRRAFDRVSREVLHQLRIEKRMIELVKKGLDVELLAEAGLLDFAR